MYLSFPWKGPSWVLRKGTESFNPYVGQTLGCTSLGAVPTAYMRQTGARALILIKKLKKTNRRERRSV